MPASAVTPMMAQFLDIKNDYPTALLFYRMGDFYELFFDDAIAASAALDITLTKRGKHQGKDIPMCGVPVHAAEGYLLRLIRKGFRVAVCEQVEDPAEAKKRGSKAVVKRAVTRLVTPGTLTEDTLLDARRHNYLAAFARIRDAAALAWTDISTGELWVTPCPLVRLGPQLVRLTPREILVSETDHEVIAPITDDSDAALTPMAPSVFDSASGAERLAQLFGIASLDAFGQFERAEISAMSAIAAYLELTQIGESPLMQPPKREESTNFVQIDAATRRNLELTQALGGARAGSLLSTIDATITAPGARLLEQRLNAPSRDIAVIHERLSSVRYGVDNPEIRRELRVAMRPMPDIERALSRLSLGRGGPRDIAAMRDGVIQARETAEILSKIDNQPLLKARKALEGLETFGATLSDALSQDVPILAREGNFIANGFDTDLDDARQLRDNGRSIIAQMQAEYAQLTDINALKIKHNNVLGYFIETPATHAQKMLAPPHSDKFIHRQTTANAIRFTTIELNEIETKMLDASSRAIQIELAHFERLRMSVIEHAQMLSALANSISEIDVAMAFAELASERDWSCPIISESRAFNIQGGRHPVVEQALRANGQNRFVANDCELSADGDSATIWLLTGPNMAGKSTYLRQNALIALMAQMGSFVPAQRAEIGLVSQVFTRVGASDDLAHGRSTFMVEMVETAAILNQADDRALVILDEIGRGTATYDGLSIAWATFEHLHDINRCRALFATHYHEMTPLAEKMTGARNATMAVKEWQGEVIFLHEVRAGTADRSYGIQVAQIAGLPQNVIMRAKEVLAILEENSRSAHGGSAPIIDDLPLFSATQQSPAPQVSPSAIEERLSTILPDTMSPREALDLLYELKSLVRANEAAP